MKASSTVYGIAQIVEVQMGSCPEGEKAPLVRKHFVLNVVSLVAPFALGVMLICDCIGKHWARFRKNRPFEYTTDPDKHRVMQAKTAHGRKHAVNEDGLSGKTIGSRSGTPDGVRKRIGRPPKAVVAARLAAAAAVSSPSPFTRASSPPRQTAAAIPSHPLSQASHSPPIAPNEVYFRQELSQIEC